MKVLNIKEEEYWGRWLHSNRGEDESCSKCLRVIVLEDVLRGFSVAVMHYCLCCVLIILSDEDKIKKCLYIMERSLWSIMQYKLTVH